MSSTSSWITESCACGECGGPVVVTQATEPGCDYWWYCADKRCANHPGTQLGDQELPAWVHRPAGAREAVDALLGQLDLDDDWYVDTRGYPNDEIRSLRRWAGTYYLTSTNTIGNEP